MKERGPEFKYVVILEEKDLWPRGEQKCDVFTQWINALLEFTNVKIRWLLKIRKNSLIFKICKDRILKLCYKLLHGNS